MRRKHRLPPAVLACLPVVTFLGVFFVVPLALNGFTSLRGADGSFSLVSYARLLSDSYYLGVTAKVKLVEPKSLQRFEGKAQRVVDKRNI